MSAWVTVAEIAAEGLPGLPTAPRKINELIAAERWALRRGAHGEPLYRKRSGKGGPIEWHSSLLPERARAELVCRGIIAAPAPAPANVVALPLAGRGEAWDAFDRLPDVRKAEAAERLRAIDQVEAHRAAGMTKTAALALVAADSGVSVSTLNAWFALIAGVGRPDRLPFLAPATRGGGREAEVDPELWDRYRSDWLRLEKPTHAACYWRLKRVADARGVTLPSAKTLQRKLERETPPEIILACREGRERVAQILPAQRRTVANLHAMHTVNIDGHVWDVRVLWPDGEIARPVMVGIQDVYSRKLLAWRVDKSESAVLTRLAFADLFKNHGIPVGCVLDNSRAFASKWITGGTKTRFRFKVREDDPQGLLPALGIQTHWATPYHGQAKPIERYWREVCSLIAKGPDFAGAYTGNSTVAKPENYRSRAIPLDQFLAVINRELPAVNAKTGRRTEMGRGGSFDQAFQRSIDMGAPVGRATEAQMRLALLAADKVRPDRLSGVITFAGNRYWAEGMLKHAGKPLVLRFDPENLHRSVYAYDLKGGFIGELAVWEDTGFHDIGAAKTRAKQVADLRRSVRAGVEAQNLLEAGQIAAALAGLGSDESEITQPQVIRPVRPARRGGAAVAAQSAGVDLDAFARGLHATERNSGRLRLVE